MQDQKTEPVDKQDSEVRTCGCKDVHINVCTYVYVNTYIYIRMYVCICVYMYMHMYFYM